MTKRLLIAMIVIRAIMSIQGCNKTWSAHFNSVDDLNRWELPPLGYDAETYISYDELNLDDVVEHAPYGFEGDFTMTLVFELSIGASNYLDMLQIILSGGDDVPSSVVNAGLDLYDN